MKSTDECFHILGISPTTDEAAIKAAFRKQALTVHPDVQGGATEASLDFVLLRNAYESLLVAPRIQPPTSPRRPHTRSAVTAPTQGGARQRLAQQLNALLWDIEDLFRGVRRSRNQVYEAAQAERDLLKPLVLIDKEVLGTAGLTDSFMTARQRTPLDPSVYLDVLGPGGSLPEHFPYTSVENYFFDIRLRMNALLERLVTRAAFPWAGPDALTNLMNTYQNCVYDVGAIGECLRSDKPFAQDFLTVRALVLTEDLDSRNRDAFRGSPGSSPS